MPDLSDVRFTTHWLTLSCTHHLVLALHVEHALVHRTIGLAVGLTLVIVLIGVAARAGGVILAGLGGLLQNGLVGLDSLLLVGLLLGNLLDLVVLLHLHLLVLLVLDLLLLHLLLNLLRLLLLVHDWLLGSLLWLLWHHTLIDLQLLVHLLHLLQLLMLLNLLQVLLVLHHVDGLRLLLIDLWLLRVHLLLLLEVLLLSLVRFEVVEALGGDLISDVRIRHHLLKQSFVVHVLERQGDRLLLRWRLLRWLLLHLWLELALSARLLHLRSSRLLVAHLLLRLLASIWCLPCRHLLWLTSHDLLVLRLGMLLYLLVLHGQSLIHGGLLLGLLHLVLGDLVGLLLLLWHAAELALSAVLGRLLHRLLRRRRLLSELLLLSLLHVSLRTQGLLRLGLDLLLHDLLLLRLSSLLDGAQTLLLGGLLLDLLWEATILVLLG